METILILFKYNRISQIIFVADQQVNAQQKHDVAVQLNTYQKQ